jgi:hypothetical protein
MLNCFIALFSAMRAAAPPFFGPTWTGSNALKKDALATSMAAFAGRQSQQNMDPSIIRGDTDSVFVSVEADPMHRVQIANQHSVNRSHVHCRQCHLQDRVIL